MMHITVDAAHNKGETSDGVDYKTEKGKNNQMKRRNSQKVWNHFR